MKLKLLINGEDKRISIEAENKSDMKLLEFIKEHDSADLREVKDPYTRDVKSVELKLFTKPVDPL